MFAAGVSENEANDRVSFITDMSTVVGSLFDEDSPINEHIGLLLDKAAGAK